MRPENFNIEHLMDHMEYKQLESDEALKSAYPGMLEEDLTNDDKDVLEAKMSYCSECYSPQRQGNLTWNDYLRNDVCDQCDYDNREEDEAEEE